MTNSPQPEKPKRLYFKTYIKLLHNSVGSNLFRNFYVESSDQGVFDALKDGVNSCAFYVSSVLVIFKKISAVHGTVQSTVKDLQESGWQLVDKPKEGDVIVWEAQQFDDGLKEHIGFALEDNKAISISWTEKAPVIHSQDFDGERKINQVFRATDWN